MIIMKKFYSIKALCVTMLLMICGFSAQAQLENSVYLNAGIPTQQFNDAFDYDPISGVASPLLGKDNIGKGATLGLGLGYRCTYRFDIGYGEVSPFLNVDFMWNQIKGSYRDSLSVASARIPKYFNIPIMLGINYSYQLTDIIKVFGEFGVGSDLFFVTSEGWKNNDAKPFCKYDTKTALCWQIGGGAYFGSHVSASLHYYGLGKHAFTYDKKSHFENMTLEEIEQDRAGLGTGYEFNKPELRSIGTLMLRIGFHF